MLATISFSDPIHLALAALGVLIWAFAGFVAFNSLQRRGTDYAGVLEGRWFYAIPQAAFVAGFVVWQMPWVANAASWMRYFYVALPLVLGQQMAYLLRVVFPTSKRLEKRLDAECAALRESDDDEPKAPARVRTRVPANASAPAKAPASPPRDSTFFDPDNPDD